ncbi:hypothetical protein PFISCL1PPCAC_965, partial [Pristionchus fissidentatus]
LSFFLHSSLFPSLRMVGSTSDSCSLTHADLFKLGFTEANQLVFGISPDEDETSLTPPAEFVRENDKGQLVNDYGEPWPRPRPKNKKTQAKTVAKTEKKKKKSESTECSRKSSRKSKRRPKKEKKEKREKRGNKEKKERSQRPDSSSKRRRSRKSKPKDAEYITLSVDSEQENSDRSAHATRERKQMDVQTSPQASRKTTE